MFWLINIGCSDQLTKLFQMIREKEINMSKEKAYSDNSLIEMFGLTFGQALLMFSAERMLANYDCLQTKNEKDAELKIKWIGEWEKAILDYLHKINSAYMGGLYPDNGLENRFDAEMKKSNNRTWYYIVVLELLEFVAYTPLGGENDKQYRKCNYDEKKATDFLKKFILRQGYLSEEKIDRLDKTYNKSISKISGKRGKIATNILAVIAIGSISAALTAVGAGSIAVLLVGNAFPGLYGAALVSACLALIGGGAVAAGGAGMAGGVAVIAGGGALLGLAGGGAAVGVGSKLLSSVPEFTLTQSAKLETILKEVILNAQQDVVAAQKIMERYQEQIIELNKKLKKMELENDKNKKELNNIKTCIKYREKSYKDMKVFTSSYEIGMQAKE